MKPPERPPPSLSAEEAINSILEAEQRTRDTLDRRRGEAQRLIGEARETARRIHERANVRSVAMRNLCERTAAERTEALRRATESARTQPVAADTPAETLARAIAALAAELTGDDPAGPPRS